MDIYNLDKINSLLGEPEQKDAFDAWVKQDKVITFLEQEIEDENIVSSQKLGVEEMKKSK